ncbi:MAG: DUF2269 family protein, partial [Armatimonadetes bacterium]|nr:DUF2269 family protein [Armatimonadota bacterium]
MTVHEILKFIHGLLAISAVGANITYGVWLARAGREPQYLGYALRGIKMLDDRIANPAYALLFVTGLLMLYTGRFAWTTPWILSALIVYVLVLGLGLFGYTPLLRRQIAILERVGHQSSEYNRIAG